MANVCPRVMGFGEYPSVTSVYFVLNWDNLLYEVALEYKNGLGSTFKPNIFDWNSLAVRTATPGTGIFCGLISRKFIVIGPMTFIELC